MHFLYFLNIYAIFKYKTDMSKTCLKFINLSFCCILLGKSWKSVLKMCVFKNTLTSWLRFCFCWLVLRQNKQTNNKKENKNGEKWGKPRNSCKHQRQSQSWEWPKVILMGMAVHCLNFRLAQAMPRLCAPNQPFSALNFCPWLISGKCRRKVPRLAYPPLLLLPTPKKRQPTQINALSEKLGTETELCIFFNFFFLS